MRKGIDGCSMSVTPSQLKVSNVGHMLISF